MKLFFVFKLIREMVDLRRNTINIGVNTVVKSYTYFIGKLGGFQKHSRLRTLSAPEEIEKENMLKISAISLGNGKGNSKNAFKYCRWSIKIFIKKFE